MGWEAITPLMRIKKQKKGIKIPKLTGPMEELKNNSFYVLVTHAKQDYLDLETCFTTYPFLNGDFNITVQGCCKEICIYGVFKYF